MEIKYKRFDEIETLKVYNDDTVKNYFNARKDGTFINTYLTIPNLRKILIEEIKGKDVLDVGCGFGEDIEWCLKNKPKSITGLEINEKFIQLAKKNQLLKNVKIHNLSIYDIEKLNQKYDIIYANMVFDQIENLDLVFNKLYNMLNKEGKIIFTSIHPLNSATSDFSKELTDYFEKKRNYFKPKSHNCKIPYYTRNFENYSKIFFQNNLLIEKIIEARPTSEAKIKFPEKYEIYSKLPAIVIFIVVKK